jgi:hypothetical protein
MKTAFTVNDSALTDRVKNQSKHRVNSGCNSTTWHTARTDSDCAMLFITPGEGAIDAEDSPD